MTGPGKGRQAVVSPRHALAVWWRNFAMYRRSWALNILPNFFEPLLYLVSMGIGVGAYISESAIARRRWKPPESAFTGTCACERRSRKSSS